MGLRLRGAQINVWSFERLLPLTEYLRREKFDFVLMEEVVDHRYFKLGESVTIPSPENDPDILAQLAETLGMQAVFAPAWSTRLPDGRVQKYGVAILSRHPIAYSHYFYDRDGQPFAEYSYEELQRKRPSTRDEAYVQAFRFPNPFLWAIVSVNGTPVRIGAAHLAISYVCTETLQRIRQAEQIVDYLRNSADLPTILGGDLNIQADSPTVSIISSALARVPYDAINTLDETIHPVFDPKNAEKNGNKRVSGLAVDHFFCSSHFSVSECRVVPRAGVSDHLPVELTTSLPR